MLRVVVATSFKTFLSTSLLSLSLLSSTVHTTNTTTKPFYKSNYHNLCIAKYSTKQINKYQMQAVRIHQTGGPEVLKFETNVDKPQPQAHQVLVKIAAAGVNYIDTYHRTGMYPLTLPSVLGREGAGVVEAVGQEVKHVQVGDRVAFFAEGGYAQYTAIPADKVAIVPNHVSLRDAAAVTLQGLTAHYLVYSTYPVKPHDTVLVHAGAGGTGGLIIQLAKLRGATVICTVSTPEKAAAVKELGADHVILYTQCDFQTEVMKLTQNKGVEVVYDGVGASTWEGSLKSLKKRGYLVLFGNASGKVPPIDPLLLTKHGSAFVTRPTLADYLLDHEELESRARDLFEAMGQNKLKIRIAKEYKLEEADQAHNFLTSRGALGKILLIPNGADSIH